MMKLLAAGIMILLNMGVGQSQGVSERIGKVHTLDVRAGEIHVSSPAAVYNIKMGDILFILIDDKPVMLETTFPMMTFAKCKPVGINRGLWLHARAGTPVYRYNKAIQNDIPKNRSKKLNYVIGDVGPGGGIVFYDKGFYTDGWRYLEAAPEDQSDGLCLMSIQRFTNGIDTNTEVGSGKQNTKILGRIKGYDYEADKLCTSYRGGGKRDWFLPSKDELNLVFVNLHSNKLGNFAVSHNNFYWSSSYNNSIPWFQSFYSGYQTNDFDRGLGRVRAIRSF